MNWQYSSALKLGGGHPKRTARVESKALGATHGELAAYLMGLWGFPATVIQAIRFHNDPKNRLDGNFTPLDAVYIANTLLHRQRDGEPDGYALTQTYLREINRAKRAPIWEEMCRDALTEERKQRRG
jgi:HD-like signal output (HDOD) protein